MKTIEPKLPKGTFKSNQSMVHALAHNNRMVTGFMQTKTDSVNELSIILINDLKTNPTVDFFDDSKQKVTLDQKLHPISFRVGEGQLELD